MNRAGTTCVASQVLVSVPLFDDIHNCLYLSGEMLQIARAKCKCKELVLKINFYIICICSFGHRNQIDDGYGITSDVLAVICPLYSLHGTNDDPAQERKSSSERFSLLMRIYLSSSHIKKSIGNQIKKRPNSIITI